MTKTDGPFKIESWVDSRAEYHHRITHTPTGIEVHEKSYSFYTDEIAAWKAMAMRLADEIAQLSNIKELPR